MKLQNILSIAVLLSACSVQAGHLQDYTQNQTAWRQKLQQLGSTRQTFRIIQVGDSHTAGDFFTDRLRQRLQQQWGNGGIGWIYPNSVSGQRMAGIRYSSTQWQAFSSRSTQGDFPFGGIMARSQGNGSINIHADASGVQNITLIAKPVLSEETLQVNGKELSAAQSGWQTLQTQAQLPLNISSTMPWDLGFINIEKPQGGVTLSAMGINGSQLSQWSKWRQDWADDLANMQPDLLIIAYGTNEAFNDNLDMEKTERIWRQSVQTIKAKMPQMAILIVGAPESLKSKAGNCGVRPQRLNDVQNMQQRIARQEQLLYWSWQDAMGGSCSMNAWRNQGLAAKDGVHFSAKGYQRAADVLADDLIQLIQ